MNDGIFDPTKPEILLFAMEGGEKLTKQELGSCVDGSWTGDPRMQIVGVAFMAPMEDFGENHPEGFAGRLDNWHIHFNVCEGEGEDSVTTKEQCEASGGRFIERVGWMIHAYTVPDFDNQAGVFANYNATVWPREEGGADTGSDLPDAKPARESVIVNFEFESPIEVAPGEAVTFRNADGVPHTVTAHTASEFGKTFDSGELRTNQSFTLSLDEPGSYEFSCKYHKFMMGTVIVK
jgi:plastocyanin